MALRKNQTTLQILTIRRILEGLRTKYIVATHSYLEIFSQVFGSIHRGKIEQILLANGLPRKTVSAIMMLYKNTKVNVCSPDEDTDFIDIVVGVLQGDTIAQCLFIISLDNALRTLIDLMKENGFTLENARSKWYLAETIMDVDYADDIALLVNTLAQTESLLHSLERASGGIGFHLNADKTEYVYFNQRDDISTLNDDYLKPVNKFSYLGSSVSSTENDIND